jgi:hypothetical protein
MLAEQVEVAAAVIAAGEHRLAVIASLRDMVTDPGEDRARAPRHRTSVARRGRNLKKCVRPLFTPGVSPGFPPIHVPVMVLG